MGDVGWRDRRKDGSGRRSSSGTLVQTTAGACIAMSWALLERSDTPPDWIPSAALEADRSCCPARRSRREQLQARRQSGAHAVRHGGGPDRHRASHHPPPRSRRSPPAPRQANTAWSATASRTRRGAQRPAVATAAGDAAQTITPQRSRRSCRSGSDRRSSRAPSSRDRGSRWRTSTAPASRDNRMASSLVTEIARVLRDPSPSSTATTRASTGQPRVRSRRALRRRASSLPIISSRTCWKPFLLAPPSSSCPTTDRWRSARE